MCPPSHAPTRPGARTRRHGRWQPAQAAPQASLAAGLCLGSVDAMPFQPCPALEGRVSVSCQPSPTSPCLSLPEALPPTPWGPRAGGARGDPPHRPAAHRRSAGAARGGAPHCQAVRVSRPGGGHRQCVGTCALGDHAACCSRGRCSLSQPLDPRKILLTLLPALSWGCWPKALRRCRAWLPPPCCQSPPSTHLYTHVPNLASASATSCPAA